MSDFKYDRSKPYFKRILGGKNWIVFMLVAAAFIWLNIYRLNDALPIGSFAPNIELTNIDGKSFNINDIRSPKVLLFYKKHTYFSNYIINSTYERALPSFKFLQDKGIAQFFMIADGYDNVDKLKELISNKDYTPYKDVVFATDTKQAGKEYGIRSWPHLFVISSDGRIIYETKIGSADKVQQIIWRN